MMDTYFFIEEGHDFNYEDFLQFAKWKIIELKNNHKSNEYITNFYEDNTWRIISILVIDELALYDS